MYRLFSLMADVISGMTKEKPKVKMHRTAQLSNSEDLQSVNNSDEKENEQSDYLPSKYYEKEEEVRYGKVTHMYQDYGLIDGYIYFSNTCLTTDVQLQVDDLVEVTAVRQSRHTGWTATSVSLHNDEWDTVRNVYQLVGVITNINSNGDGTINNEHRFTAKCLKNYEPWRGDKVQIQVVDNGSTRVIEKAEPFTIQQYTGRVVAVGQHFCFIDGNLAFTRSCCVGSYSPRKGDMVCGKMIECDQAKQWKHRALTVQLQSSQTPESNLGAGTSNQLPLSRAADDSISISGHLCFNDIPLGETSTHTIFIKNGGRSPVKLQNVSFSDSAGAQFTFSRAKILLEGRLVQSMPLSSSELSLLPGMTAYFNLTFTPRYIGEDKQQLDISFDHMTKCVDVIGRCISDGVIPERTGPVSQKTYRQVRHNIQPTDGNRSTMPGVRPMFRGSRLPKNLPQFSVPIHLRHCILNETRRLSQQYPIIEQELSKQNYTSKFSLLLHIEEVNAEIEIRKFDVDEAIFNRSRGYLTLVVPGLPDGQPSLMVGDKLSVTVNSHMQSIEYEGFIYEIICDTIYVKFHSSFHGSYNEDVCYVIFHISRVPFRRMQNAVKMVQQIEWPGLFPNYVSVRGSILRSNICNEGGDKWLFNKALNQEQSLGVRRVLEAKCRPFPHVIFGPPGTGKTVTMVESVLQVYNRVRGSRILFCAPSNSAADLVTTQLVKSFDWPENSLVRLISYSRQDESLPEDIRKYCRDGQHLPLIAEHRVIVSTCVSAGMLFGLGLSTKHFSHVFIDEAGQASEPECLIPISLIAANPEGSIVLAGDHKQLGAVVKSQISENCGLSMSLLERVMNHPPYQKHSDKFHGHSNYDPNLVTKLLRNYRAHPFILSLYSQLFYDNELIVCAGATAYSLQHMDVLPSAQKPIIFHGLQGEELREGNNPSWFNAVEVVQVVKYLKAVLKLCSVEEVGVITPYRKQVEKIRQMMQCVGIDPEVKVGSVEEFQGQERKAIIVSTVRSRTEGVDALGNTTIQSLGFLSNSKRFNVSISRAQALLIVVGNPCILCQDVYWKHLIDYCISNCCYVGVDYQQEIQEH